MGAYVIANNIDPYILPGTETTADANIGTVAGYEGMGIQESYVNYLDSGFNIGFPVSGGFFDGGFGGIFGGTEGGPPPGGFGDY